MNYETCVCCGDVIPEGVHLCRKCAKEVYSDKLTTAKFNCVNYNENGYFCELIGAECIGDRCMSYKEE